MPNSAVWNVTMSLSGPSTCKSVAMGGSNLIRWMSDSLNGDQSGISATGALSTMVPVKTKLSPSPGRGTGIVAATSRCLSAFEKRWIIHGGLFLDLASGTAVVVRQSQSMAGSTEWTLCSCVQIVSDNLGVVARVQEDREHVLGVQLEVALVHQAGDHVVQCTAQVVNNVSHDDAEPRLLHSCPMGNEEDITPSGDGVDVGESDSVCVVIPEGSWDLACQGLDVMDRTFELRFAGD